MASLGNSSTAMWQDLKSGLRQFGLNPADWNMKQQEHSTKVRLVHRRDPHVQLEGTVEATAKPIWQALRLVSL